MTIGLFLNYGSADEQLQIRPFFIKFVDQHNICIFLTF